MTVIRVNPFTTEIDEIRKVLDQFSAKEPVVQRDVGQTRRSHLDYEVEDKDREAFLQAAYGFGDHISISIDP